MIIVFRTTIPAWIHVRLPCLPPSRLMPFCSKQICTGPVKRKANPGSMDGVKLTIYCTVYPFPGEYDGLSYNLTKSN